MHNVPHTEEAKAKMSATRTGVPAPWKRRPTKVENGVTLYRCGKCFGFFPFDDFYKSKRTILGIKGECKQCHMRTCIDSRDKDAARERSAQYMVKARAADPEKFRAIDREKHKASKAKYPEKIAARQAVNDAVKRGELIRPNECEDCSTTKFVLHGHHDDYSKPLAVRWLCPKCHGKVHRTTP